MRWRYLPSKRKTHREALARRIRRKHDIRHELKCRPWWEVKAIYGPGSEWMA